MKRYGGGLIFRVVSNSLDIYTIGFTSNYSLMDDMNFTKFPIVED